MTTDVHTTTGDRLYGPQTELGVRNFPLRGRAFGDLVPFVRNYALVKLAAARANHTHGVLDDVRRDAIVAACQEIVDGVHPGQFPTPLVHGGGGTTANMNVNEVVAARAAQIAGVAVHPNDHVNASQSTNDTYPTAMALTLLELVDAPVTALRELAAAFDRKAEEFDGVEHLGRTCLQDAVSLTAGDSHRGHAAALRRVADGLREAAHALHEVPIGGTAVGTGIGAPDGFAEQAAAELAELTGRPVAAAPNRFDAMSHMDPYAAIAAAGSRAAITMAKIAADIRLLSAGPQGGFGDLTIPAVQAGSSIMPTKVNPVIPEYVMQLGYRVRGQALTVDCAVADGELELNVMEPVVIDALTTIFDDLTAAAETFARRCVDGLAWDGPHRERNLAGALDHWVELSAAEGYETATTQLRGTVTTQLDGTATTQPGGTATTR
ncbi:aspartate ammonia-lyase [Streptomyces samsunensis]|uniref:lyase family protein n=1 Tax=Streptomyces malaysiensis TaxID=92644 RepID=UPI0015829E47|nr:MULTISPECIES: lyase family protein [Streptomyces]MCM3810671.1 lyase family protein [Streptomyces sp. DR7-3]NUH39296.1 aspartate ammonia-lyase [Streptomyces samsunensis]